MPLMTIAQAAEAAGISPKMARHYEALGLLTPTARSSSGYRLYGPQEIRTLRIIGRTRDLGFPLASVARLLKAAHHQQHEEIGEEIGARIAEIEQELQRLTRLLGALRSLDASLEPFDRVDCPAAIERQQRRAASLSACAAPSAYSGSDRGPAGGRALCEAWGLALPAARRAMAAGRAQEHMAP